MNRFHSFSLNELNALSEGLRFARVLNPLFAQPMLNEVAEALAEYKQEIKEKMQ